MITVYLDESQNLDQAFDELAQKYYCCHASRWYKRRYGFYEKPSLLKAKRKKMRAIVSNQAIGGSALWLKIAQPLQFARTGKNAVGH